LTAGTWWEIATAFHVWKQRSKSDGGRLGLVFLLLAGLWRFIAWIAKRLQTDPLDAEVEQKLSEPEAVEVCPHCLTQQPPTAWFCKHCGKAVGPYNNLMPYLNVFSEGEV